MVAQKIINVRDVKLEDLPSIYEIAQNSFKDPYPPKLLKHIHSTNPEGFLAAEIGNKIVGYLIGLLRWGNIGHILAIAVDEPFRRQGVGSALIINAISRLKNGGASKVELEVRISNDVAREFYKEMGFEKREVVPAYYSDGETAISMEYKLD